MSKFPKDKLPLVGQDERFVASWEAYFAEIDKALSDLKWHGTKADLQGGIAGERYHLTEAEYTALAAFVTSGIDHNDTNNKQGGAASEFYHLSYADYLAAVAFFNGGTSTQTDIDTAITNSENHIADAGLHNLVFDQLAYTYTLGKETGEVVSLSASPLKTLVKTYDTSGNIATVTDGVSTWTFSYNGAGFLTGSVKT